MTATINLETKWRVFERVLAIKILLFYFAKNTSPSMTALQVTLATLLFISFLIITCSQKALWGWVTFLFVQIVEVFNYFPWTPNHMYIEALLCLLAVLYYLRPTQPSMIGTTKSITVILALSFFYAGVQKIVQGQWLNGEYLAHHIFFAPDWNQLARFLRWSTEWLFSTSVEPQSIYSLKEAFTHPHLPSILFFTQTMSRSVVILEIILPLLLFTKRFSSLAVLGLIALQLGIAMTAGIWGFAITGSACLALGLNHFPKYLSYFLITLSLGSFALGLLENFNVVKALAWF